MENSYYENLLRQAGGVEGSIESKNSLKLIHHPNPFQKGRAHFHALR